MTDHSQEFKVVVESPHGKRPTQEFEHFLRKVSSEAKERWGIDITVERHNEEET